jgi:inhibitor of KinA sporulation pathway (predicted exonuclease)
MAEIRGREAEPGEREEVGAELKTFMQSAEVQRFVEHWSNQEFSKLTEAGIRDMIEHYFTKNDGNAERTLEEAGSTLEILRKLEYEKFKIKPEGIMRETER